jgi:hypothetical protein
MNHRSVPVVRRWVAVGAARRHHGDLDAVDELVEVVELLFERDFHGRLS